MAAEIRVRVLLLLLLLVAVAGSMGISARQNREPLIADLRTIPLNFGDVVGIEDQIDARTLDVLQASQTLNRLYYEGDHKYWLFVGYFAQQRFGSQIHSPRHCYPGRGWNFLSSESAAAELVGGAGCLLIQKNKDRRVVLYQYLTRGGPTTSEYRLKWELIKSSLLGRPLDAAFVRFSTALVDGEDEAEARERLRRFVDQLAPSIEPALPF
jgi:EpsI family protein